MTGKELPASWLVENVRDKLRFTFPQEEKDQVLVKSRFHTRETKIDEVDMEKDFLWAWLNGM